VLCDLAIIPGTLLAFPATDSGYYSKPVPYHNHHKLCEDETSPIFRCRSLYLADIQILRVKLPSEQHLLQRNTATIARRRRQQGSDNKTFPENNA
jgi:hypothetical protein